MQLAEVRWMIHRYRLKTTPEILMTASCIQLINTCIGMQVPSLAVLRWCMHCIELGEGSLVLLVVPRHQQVVTTSIVVPLAIH